MPSSSSSSSSSSTSSTSSSWASSSSAPLNNLNPNPLSEDDSETCQRLLKDCEMFHRLSPPQIATVASNMHLRTLGRNETVLHQGQATESFYVLAKGDIRREFLDPTTGKRHTVEFEIKAKSINSMRVLSGDPIHSTVKCVGDRKSSENKTNLVDKKYTTNSACKLFEMPRQRFLHLLQARPDITIQIASSLSDEVRTSSKKYATPLLEQKQQQLDVPAVMIAAGVESYYRSALNAQINHVLTGVRSDWFPNMHIQVPVRIAYITGFKGLRTLLDNSVDTDTYSSGAKNWIRLGMALAPGVLMTPVSSLLEASNAGHINNEPMATRWMRGIAARCGREVIFGLGLNQLSDYLEERWQTILGRGFTSPIVANAAGSISAGVISGYLSHVPHNLSTYKLLEPHRSYGDLYRMFVTKSVPPSLERTIQQSATSPFFKQVARYTAATLFPRGLIVRTVQIVGSFMILNGTINYLQLREHKKLQRQADGSGSSTVIPKIAVAVSHPLRGDSDTEDEGMAALVGHSTSPGAATLQRIVSRPD
jgi:CRP-like cAMP-binding protein